MSTIADIADEVTRQLNETTFSKQLHAFRHYQPRVELRDSKTVQVPVVPKALGRERNVGRNTGQELHQIDVGVLKKLKGDANVNVDPWTDFLEEIGDHFLRQRFTTPSAICFRIENDPIYDVDALNENRQFISVLTLSYRIFR